MSHGGGGGCGGVDSEMLWSERLCCDWWLYGDDCVGVTWVGDVLSVGMGLCGADIGRIGVHVSVVYRIPYLLLIMKQTSSWALVFLV